VEDLRAVLKPRAFAGGFATAIAAIPSGDSMQTLVGLADLDRYEITASAGSVLFRLEWVPTGGVSVLIYQATPRVTGVISFSGYSVPMIICGPKVLALSRGRPLQLRRPPF
jgi:hypothetical protein